MAAGLLDADSGSQCVRVLVGGEPIPRALAERMAAATGVTFYNVYGPTEATVEATLSVVKAGTSGYNIGRPLDNARIYILDEQRVIVYGHGRPIGTVDPVHPLEDRRGERLNPE